MKTFKDLVFEQHRSGIGVHAKMEFDNGYGISVVSGDMFYCDSESPYEIAIIGKNGVCYNTPIADDVIGYQTEADVTELMRQIQELPVREVKDE